MTAPLHHQVHSRPEHAPLTLVLTSTLSPLAPIVDTGDKNRELRLAGKVVKIVPPRRLVVTRAFPSDEAREEKRTRATFEIEPVRDVIRRTVTHDRLGAGSKMLEGITAGRPKVLSSLKTLLEVRRPLPQSW